MVEFKASQKFVFVCIIFCLVVTGTSSLIPAYSMTAYQYLQQNNTTQTSTVNGGAIIELDQKVYSWTDVVYITVVAPSCNTNPNIADIIGDGTCGIISIKTGKGQLNSYRLVESGSDTGIFMGKITLGGPRYISGNANGIGPTDGLISSSPNDSIQVTFTRGVQGVTGSAMISSPTPSISVTTDKTSYNYGDEIVISGHIQPVISGIPLIIVVQSQNCSIHLGEADVNSDGSFSKQVYANGSIWSCAGNYDTVTALYGTYAVQGTSFSFNSTPIQPQVTNSTSMITPSSVPSKIPAWVKNIFIWYGRGSISDDELISALQFLIQQGIIKVS